MKITKRQALIIVSSLFLAIVAVRALPAIYTTRELISGKDAPKEYFIDTARETIEAPEDDQCASCAAAYVMRYFKEDIRANDLYPDINRAFGAVTPSCVVSLLQEHGYHAKAYHGDLDTMKKRLSEGKPLIVYLRAPDDLYYAVVTGYDEEHIYLADPMTENAYGNETTYNTIIDNEEFGERWKTGFPIADNVYITAEKNAGQ